MGCGAYAAGLVQYGLGQMKSNSSTMITFMVLAGLSTLALMPMFF